MKSNSIFWNFRTIKILTRGKNQMFDLSIDFHEFQVFARDHDGRYQTFSYGELGVSISRWTIVNSIIWNTGRSLFQCREKNRQYYHRECFHNYKAFHWDFDRRLKAVVISDKGGRVWMSRMIFDMIFWKVLDSQDSDVTNKINDFTQLNTPLQVLIIRLSSWWRDSKL